MIRHAGFFIAVKLSWLKRRIIAEVAGSSPATATIKLETMTISEKEIREDFRRFIRHEAMRANCSQDEIINIINLNKKSL